ncbi:MAG TPA: HWE histidine kinase domain-containing protein [Marinobacterium sp.]|nr:HWE histidine kinase domain-containing protein [Marinobacterium sp.]
MTTKIEPIQYDLSNCDREPIHKLGRIHSGGGLVALSADWLVSALSSDLPARLGCTSDDILGQQLNQIITSEAVACVTKAAAGMSFDDQVERLLCVKLFDQLPEQDISLHFCDDSLILEFSESESDQSRIHSQSLRTALRQFGQAGSSLELCQSAAISVGSIVDFDRIMIYKFHPDGSGEVIAEHLNANVDSFIGLRYPPSDIPQQARALYKRSLLRTIPDVEDAGIDIVPKNANIDLSLCTLRAVSPVHLEYLKNMGIKASMSISILIDGELWGLIACHHYSPRSLTLEAKTYAELFAESFALELRSQLYKEASEGTGGARRLHMQMMAALDLSAPLLENLSTFGAKIRQTLPCDSLVLSIDGEQAVFGEPVSGEDITLLARRLNREATTRVTAVENLGNWLDADVTVAERFAGMLAIPISKRPRDLLIFLRREETSTVTWAGNPEKPVELGPNGSRLTPRKSFAAWRELRTGFCRPWTPQELNLANELRSTLLELIVRSIDERSKIADEAQQQQDMLIHELNHRVRNILGLINSIVSQTATSVDNIDVFKSILAGRIQALALAQNMLTERNWSQTPFENLLQTEIKAFVAEQGRISRSGPEVMLTPKAYTTMTLLIHELITNATKYGALSNDSGHIHIRWGVDPSGNLEITWRETGVTIESLSKRQGFGSLIIKRAIPLDLGGEVEFNIERSGATGRFLIPSRHFSCTQISNDSPQTYVAATAPVEPAEFSGDSLGTALLVEDNMIIALDEESALLSMGFDTVELCTSVATANIALEKGPISFAVLDINLGAETSEPIAKKLVESGVPFIFATGYNEGLGSLKQSFDVEVLKKPFTSDDLIECVKAVLDNSE